MSVALEKARILEEIRTYEKIIDLGNTEIFINYCNEIWYWNEISIDEAFALSMIMNLSL